ncbi:MAG: hypothetical protein SFX73_01815 [Kofleriaceae bacterium]|nr:hypothetical protein [Kofleriaceae bacterium]
MKHWTAGLLLFIACGDDGGGGTRTDGGNGNEDGGGSDAEMINPDAGKVVTTWGTNGIAITGGGNVDSLTCIVEQTEPAAMGGRIVFAGRGSAGSGLYTGFAWGSVFGNGMTPSNEGIMVERIGGAQSGDVNNCTATADNEVYVSGTARANAGVKYAAVFKLAGSVIDTTWGDLDGPGGGPGVGQATTESGAGVDNGSEGYAAVELSDGKVVLAGGYRTMGDVDNRNFYLYRFEASGLPDYTFGPDPTYAGSVSPAGGIGEAHVPIILSDGRILAAGRIDNAIAVQRFTATGALDGTFGTVGTVKTMFAVERVAFSPPSSLLGFSNAGGKVTLYRASIEGVADATFGTDGALEPTVPAMFYALDVVVQPNGKILVAGYDQGDGALVVLRFTAAGAPDTTWNGTGVTKLDVSSRIQVPQGPRLLLGKDGTSVYVGAFGVVSGNIYAQYFAVKLYL